jgi:hypothetical protein
VGVVGVDVGVEGAGVEDQRDGAISEARITSIRSETSPCPVTLSSSSTKARGRCARTSASRWCLAVWACDFGSESDRPS